MMMRMLQAGGLPVAVDNVRQADEDNPKGYYELEIVKQIKSDRSWLEGVRGKVVKMVSMLLFDLPADHRYKVIFMQRDLSEVLASQRTMLERKGEKFDEQEMRQLFGRHLLELNAWLETTKNIEVLRLNYSDVLSRTAEVVGEILRFLDMKLDAARMAASVEPALYRQRQADGRAAQTVVPPTGCDSIAQSEKEKVEAQLRSLGYM